MGEAVGHTLCTIKSEIQIQQNLQYLLSSLKVAAATVETTMATDNPMNEDDDLYGDLHLAAAAKLVPGKQQLLSSSSRPTASLSPETSQLQQQIKTLQAENEALKKNMGILYRTAKSELERKDRRIDELQNELDARR